MKNRRTLEGYRLRIYIDAIKEVKAMTNEQWIEGQAAQVSSGAYMTRGMWIAYLEACAIGEAEKIIRMEAA